MSEPVLLLAEIEKIIKTRGTFTPSPLKFDTSMKIIRSYQTVLHKIWSKSHHTGCSEPTHFGKVEHHNYARNT